MLKKLLSQIGLGGLCFLVGMGMVTMGMQAALADEPIDEIKEEAVEVSEETIEQPAETTGEEVAVLETSEGTIVLAFYEDVAPRHVKNFKKLAEDNFYDGTKFHRILSGFMMQGGCPKTQEGATGHPGTGGPGWNVKAEFNDRPHVKGTLSMARSQDPDSAGSQFFICFGRAEFLDNQYTAFGEVIQGMDVVETIETFGAARDPEPPKKDIVLESVRIVPRSSLAAE